jgi:two-component system, NarL family, nitrate/nitrite response regulator NarL
MEPNPDSKKIRVLVADSSRIHTQLLANVLQRDQDLVIANWDSNPANLIPAVVAQKVDVLAIGDGLGGRAGAGLKIVRDLHSLQAKTKILVLLDSHESQLVTEAFRAGARGVFNRECSVEMFSKCIHSVDRGEIWADSRGVSLAIDALAASPVIRTADAAGLKLLSKREFEVVECVVQGMTNREIAERLRLSQHTVKNYLFRVFDKLGVSSRVELLFMTLGRNRDSGNRGEPMQLSHPLRQVFEGGALDRNTTAGIEKAADEGLPAAQFLLAQALATRGGESEMEAAYTWYLIAAEQARRARSQVAAKLSPKQIEEAQRNAGVWFGRAKQIAPAIFAAALPVVQGDTHAVPIPAAITPEVAKPVMRASNASRQTHQDAGNDRASSADQALRYGSA